MSAAEPVGAGLTSDAPLSAPKPGTLDLRPVSGGIVAAVRTAVERVIADEDKCVADEETCFAQHPIHLAWRMNGENKAVTMQLDGGIPLITAAVLRWLGANCPHSDVLWLDEDLARLADELQEPTREPA